MEFKVQASASSRYSAWIRINCIKQADYAGDKVELLGDHRLQRPGALRSGMKIKDQPQEVDGLGLDFNDGSLSSDLKSDLSDLKMMD